MHKNRKLEPPENTAIQRNVKFSDIKKRCNCPDMKCNHIAFTTYRLLVKQSNMSYSTTERKWKVS